jgi:hypothetical protein
MRLASLLRRMRWRLWWFCTRMRWRLWWFCTRMLLSRRQRMLVIERLGKPWSVVRFPLA